MYCKNCGAQIPDNSSVCNYCGAAQMNNQNPNSVYQPVLEPIKKGSIIVALVLSVLTSNIIGIVLTILALIYANDYDTAIRHGDFVTAEKKKSSIRTFKIVSWVFIGLTVLFYIALFAIFGTVIFSALLEGDFDLDEFYYANSVYAAVQALKFGLLG